MFEFESFGIFKKQFPDDILDTVIQSYPFLSRNKLKTELQIIYGRDDFRNVRKTTDLLGFFIDNLSECFGEVMKLLKIIITVPMTSSEAERCFSCLNRIKTFLRSTMEEERLTALAMLSMEKDFVHQLVDFNESVIDKFAAKKERRMDFLYKHSAISTINSRALGLEDAGSSLPTGSGANYLQNM